ncbi:copper homeostasis protein CutC [Marinoscillum sp. 108]|uniref:copper homeostasis protein CutC n=1 Tax=Marinoscillum sp. 108 TaxID=2653151 RepID=UPI0012F0936A|nr:copper homeostasis protein CutC [Marinoscillum sp. 108]VXD18797.1 Copper homeostasis protein CutC [Marinoscillum sp. 108]
MKTIIEVCIDSIESAINAEAGGADRVELCDNLAEGGTTPSAGLIRAVSAQIGIGLQVMIRPRGGDFLYSSAEIEAMKHDIQVAKDLKVDGVVFGCLTREGDVDLERMAELMAVARPMNVTFHRAFDMVQDPMRALDMLISLGVDRVLTSGLQPTAPEGADMIAKLVSHAASRVIILAGGGVRPHNIQQLIEQTGVRECHVSGRTILESKMTYRNPGVMMGGTTHPSEYERLVVDSAVIRSFRSA